MKITKRVYVLHNGFLQGGYHNITKFVNTDGKVCDHTDDYCYWQHLGVFLTRGDANKFAKGNHIKLDIHSITVHSDWMYESILQDVVKTK